jgi:hypothetical protein
MSALSVESSWLSAWTTRRCTSRPAPAPPLNPPTRPAPARPPLPSIPAALAPSFSSLLQRSSTMSSSTFDPNNAQNLDDVRRFERSGRRSQPFDDRSRPLRAQGDRPDELTLEALLRPGPLTLSDREAVRLEQLVALITRRSASLMPSSLIRPQVRRRRRRAHGRTTCACALPVSCRARRCSRASFPPTSLQTYEKLISQIPPRKLSLTKCVPTSPGRLPGPSPAALPRDALRSS